MTIPRCLECGGPLSRWARRRHRACMRQDTEARRAMQAQGLSVSECVSITGLDRKQVQKVLRGSPVSPQTARLLGPVLKLEERLMVRRRR